MGPQDPKDVNRDTARDLSALVGELAALKGDATHWLTDPEYAALRLRLEAALVEASTTRREEDGEITPSRDEERDRDRSSEGEAVCRLLLQSTQRSGHSR